MSPSRVPGATSSHVAGEEEVANEEEDNNPEITNSSSGTDDSSCASWEDLANHRRGAKAVAVAKKRKRKKDEKPKVVAIAKKKKRKNDEKPGGNGRVKVKVRKIKIENDSPPKVPSTKIAINVPSSAIAAAIIGGAVIASGIETKVSGTDKSAAETSEEFHKTVDHSAATRFTADTKIKKENMELNDVKQQTQVKAEDDSGDSSSTDDEDCVKVKSVHEKNGSDNSGNEETKRRLNAADAITRAVAEDMVRNASMGRKEPIAITPANSSQPVAQNHSSSTTSAISSTQQLKNLRNTNVGKESFKMELNFQHQNLAQADQLRADQLRSTQFPFRLHNMLDDAERSGHAHILSWCKDGNSFKIHKPVMLIDVLQKYFRQSKFKSFLRQLQGYNFKRITRGKDQGVVSHPLFIRGRRSMSTYMKRKRVGPKVNNTEVEAKHIAASRAAGVDNAFVSPTTATANRSAASTKDKAAAAIYDTNISNNNKQIPYQPPQPAHSSAPIFNKNNAQKQPSMTTNPLAQDVLCVNVTNVENFQGNLKLTSIVKKITGHYKSANESVKTMIVNEISTRLQKGGSRFLKLGEDSLSWTECNREEVFRKVTSCFEVEIRTAIDKYATDFPNDKSLPNIMKNNDSGNKMLARIGTKSGGTSLDSKRRQELPRDQDVVLRGGPCSEKEGNAYLITMIQANVGQQIDSFEMKRIKCRAILERMKRRGSRFFLKLNETEADDEMYLLTDTEAQDVIYTAFCAEEEKIQSVVVDSPSASLILQRQALAGIDGLRSAHSSLGGSSQFGSVGAAQQNDALLLNRLRANNDISLLSSQALKRSSEAHNHLSNEDILEKRLRQETDEHMKLLLERARQQHSASYSANGLPNGLAGGLQFNAQKNILDSTLPSSIYSGGGGNMEQYLTERHVEEMALQSAVVRNQFAAGPAAGLVGEIPKSNSHFVEFLKKKYNTNGQERRW